jgi:secreted trypsin-like serine protease
MGDSGSPLVTNALIEPYLIGIVSWGVPCSAGFPDVYTRIDYYHDWIDSVINF